MDDYLDVRMISTPFCLYDCDVPCDGATAVIVSRVDTARRPAQARRIQVEAVGTALRGRPSLGPVRRPHHDGEPRRRRAALGRAPTSSRRDVQLARDVRRLLVHHDDAGSRRWASAAGESGPVRRGRHAHRPRRRAAAQHPRRPALGRSAPRLRLPARGVRPALGRGRRPPGPEREPEVAVAAAGGGNTCGCLLLVRD